MSKQNKILVWVVAVLVVVGAVYTITTNKTSQNDKQETIKIGVIADLTGPMSLYGGWVKNGIEIAFENENKSNGVRKNIQILIEDGKSDPKTSVSALQKLISVDRVKVIITGTGSSSVMAMAPIANENKVLLFVSLASSPSITNAGDFIFRNRVNGTFEANAIADYIQKKGYKRVAAIAMNNEAGLPYINAFEERLSAMGVQLIARDLLQIGDMDLRTKALSLKEKNPDAVFTVLLVEQAATFFNRSIELGLKPTWFGISSLKSDDLYKQAKNSSEGTIIANEGIDENNPFYTDFNNIYKLRYGENAGIYSINGYDAFKIIINIVKKVGYNTEKIKNVLYETHNYVGAGGKIDFDENGEARRDVQLMKLENGTFIKLNE